MPLPKPGFLRVAWNLAWPYWTGDQKWSARGLLGAVVVLNLISVWLNVRLNAWNAQFYNALQEYNWEEFWWQFTVFGMIAAALIVVAVYQLYLRQILQIRWRAWLTDRFLNDWLSHQTYYRMQLDHTTTDNPDQRISDDIDRYTSVSLALSTVRPMASRSSAAPESAMAFITAGSLTPGLLTLICARPSPSLGSTSASVASSTVTRSNWGAFSRSEIALAASTGLVAITGDESRLVRSAMAEVLARPFRAVKRSARPATRRRSSRADSFSISLVVTWMRVPITSARA